MKEQITKLNTDATNVIHNFRDIDFMTGHWESLSESERLVINDQLASMAALQKDIAAKMVEGKNRFWQNGGVRRRQVR
jgi:hypothetical protein